MLGAGVFVEAEVQNRQVKSDIGTGIIETAAIAKAFEHLENKKKNISANITRLQKKKQEIATGLAGLEEALKQMRWLKRTLHLKEFPEREKKCLTF